jgi:hypothetical protein
VANLSEIPAGLDRTFTLSARNADGDEIYHGVATGVTITAGQTAAVSISGQENDPPPPVTNRAPVIDALVGTTTRVAQGGSIALAVTAHDDDSGDLITYLWAATGGTLSTPAQANTSWTAPAADGTYRVTVQVQDTHGGAASMYVDLTVSADTSSQATIAVTLNKWPVVTSVTSSQGRIDVNESTTLDVTATDADDDPLTYAWSVDSGCVGAFDGATLKSPTFTLGATLPAAGTCQFTVVVSDGRSGTNSGSLTVTAAAPPPVNLAPRITSAVQSLASVQAGQTVNLAVTAEDPEGTALTFIWTTTGGTLGTPTTAAGESQVVWTAPNPLTADGSVTCTVTDATSLTTVKTFTIAAIDTTVPALTAFSFTPTVVDVSAAAATVTVTASITDDLSGVDQAAFMFAGPGDTQWLTCWMYRPAGASGLKTFSDSCAVQIPLHMAGGAWQVVQVYLVDQAANSVRLATADLVARGFAVDLTVVSSDADVTGPVIQAFSLDPLTADVAASGVTVTATFTVADAKSGIGQAGVKLASPSGTQTQICRIYPPAGTTPPTLTGSCTVVIPQGSEVGTWTVQWVYAEDAAENLTMLRTADLAAAGLPSSLLVTTSP